MHRSERLEWQQITVSSASASGARRGQCFDPKGHTRWMVRPLQSVDKAIILCTIVYSDKCSEQYQN